VVESIGLKDKESKAWNTANLGRRLGVDAMSAAAAGGLVAPVICAIDKYVFISSRPVTSTITTMLTIATEL
jgi:hypothetical protein